MVAASGPIGDPSWKLVSPHGMAVPMQNRLSLGVKMSAPLIIIVGLVYAYIAADQYFRGNVAMSIVYAGYAFSNIGLFLSIK